MQAQQFVTPAADPEFTQPQPGAPRNRRGGPKTPEGKRRSSLNATKHNIFGKIIIAPGGELETYRSHSKLFFAEYQPVGAIESDLVQRIADLRYRLKRCVPIEQSIFAVGFEDFVDRIDTGLPEVDAAFTEGPTWSRNKRDLMLLTLYESRLENSLKREIAYLEKLQTERKAAYAQAEAEAIRLKQLAESEGEVYEPANDFVPSAPPGKFVFSAEAIAPLIARQPRLQRAPHSLEPPPHPSRREPHPQKATAPK